MVGGTTAVLLFLGSERTTVLASHDAVVRPTLDGVAVLHLGPVLPDVRQDVGSRVGVDITLGKTEAASTQQLLNRYAFIASQPDAQLAKVRTLVADMAVSAGLRGAVVGVVPVVVWLLVGPARRRELVGRLHAGRRPTVAAGVVVVLLAGTALVVVQPWGRDGRDDTLAASGRWIPLQTFVGDAVPLPAEAARLEVFNDVTTQQSRRLVESAIDTYEKSKTFYRKAVDDVAELALHEPEEGQTVALLVSDRHDNIGMDPVARAIADRGGATLVLDAGDDTSTGKEWEAFSLDSLADAFADWDDDQRWFVAGNHDNGPFMARYLADRGWRHLTGDVERLFGDSRLVGVDDPRSSGLGTWREERGLTFDEVRQRLADDVCAAEERVNTVLVHDAKLGAEVLERGCADLVVGGHLHVRVGPTRVEAANGNVGWSFTNGTTGGAAYAIAVGSKPKRVAEVTLLTYDEDGRPAGTQVVGVQPNGRIDVGDYTPLTYPAGDPADPLPGPTSPTEPTDAD